MKKQILITTQIDGTSLVAGTMITAIEGGSNYWYWVKVEENWYEIAKRYDIAEAKKETPQRESLSPFPILISNALIGVEHFAMNVYNLDDTDKLLGTLTIESFVRGCEICVTKYPKRWHNFMTGNFDADDADVLFQLAVMGDVVFS
jgi:hypothetical protein